MSVLVFGAEGMLGSELMRTLPDAYGTTRRDRSDSARVLPGIDISIDSDLRRAIYWVHSKTIVNCAGIVKSECSRHDPEQVVAVNCRAPHAMAKIARTRGARFVQVSTDCIFNGRRGGYQESDPTDAEDLYGQSKAAGEIIDRPDCLTIRTSFIGRDARRRRGLLEWLLSHEGGIVPGFVRALWSGLSAPELAGAIALAIETPYLSGLYHVSGPTVSKADLLEVLVQELGIQCRVERVDGDPIDRTLDSARFIDATGYVSPGWVEMARGLTKELTDA